MCHLDSSGLYYNSDWLRSPPGGCRLTTGLNRNRADLDLTRLVPVVFALSPKVSFFVDFLHLLIQPITNNISTCIRLGWQTCLWSSTTGVRCYNHHLVCTWWDATTEILFTKSNFFFLFFVFFLIFVDNWQQQCNLLFSSAKPLDGKREHKSL